MFVLKRDGRKEPVHFDKITARITKLSYGLNPDFCDPVSAHALWVPGTRRLMASLMLTFARPRPTCGSLA